MIGELQPTSTKSDPVRVLIGAGERLYFFWDEVWVELCGPFLTEAACREELFKYCKKQGLDVVGYGKQG